MPRVDLLDPNTWNALEPDEQMLDATPLGLRRQTAPVEPEPVRETPGQRLAREVFEFYVHSDAGSAPDRFHA